MTAMQPFFADGSAGRAPGPAVVFFNPFRNLYGGSEQECLHLGDRVAELHGARASYRATTSKYDGLLRRHGVRYDTLLYTTLQQEFDAVGVHYARNWGEAWAHARQLGYM